MRIFLMSCRFAIVVSPCFDVDKFSKNQIEIICHIFADFQEEDPFFYKKKMVSSGAKANARQENMEEAIRVIPKESMRDPCCEKRTFVPQRVPEDAEPG